MPSSIPRSFPAAVAILLALGAGNTGSAQQGNGTPWTFRTGALLSGSSDTSLEGYKVLSGIGLGAGVRRNISSVLSAEFNAAVVSREVILEEVSGDEASVGSMETLPMNLLAQVRPQLGGGVHPYGGVGLNFTPVWEKTGALDSDDIAPTFGVAVQLGVDFDLSRTVLLNLDLGWNTAEPDIEAGDVRITTITINPLTLSAGVGFRF